MNEQIRKYLESLASRLALPLAPCSYTTMHLSHVVTNDWIATAYPHEYVAPLFVGPVELCHGLLSTPWGAHRMNVKLHAIGEAGAFKASMQDALAHSCMLWNYATSTPISEVLMNKQTIFFLDNESLFLDMTTKYNKAVRR